MMETEQTAASCHAPGQTSVRTWLSSSIRAAPRTPSDTTSRFHGDGVRYKAKLIGVDPVPDAQGEKMCWDSMMKLKGFEAAARKQGKHKQRVWLKVSSSGLRIVDERTGAVLYDHDRSRISSLTKDESDPRALAYVSQHQDTYCLFYIKMANLADPVLVDIEEVCQNVDQETPQEAAEAPTQNNSLLLLSDTSAPPAESTTRFFIWTIKPEPPKPKLCTSQILSMFPAQPLGGSPYSSPPYSPTGTIPWGQQGLLGNQWAGSAVAPCPTIPSSMASWAPTDMAVGQILAQGPQPRVMGGGNTLASPTAVTGYPTPLNSFYAPTGATGPLQSVSPSVDQNRYL
ncbi:hypothetical protein FQN60_012817 [Etheostoma spectabile]|uniref:PID domain-containing protein n=1 Tax=Etheostoma spectabile TaxID=54343 RepID=A0A5J5D418_9PERO|nr:hypothetical protein FQN60_012817 [Etheostoma spectabile]